MYLIIDIFCYFPYSNNYINYFLSILHIIYFYFNLKTLKLFPSSLSLTLDNAFLFLLITFYLLLYPFIVSVFMPVLFSTVCDILSSDSQGRYSKSIHQGRTAETKNAPDTERNFPMPEKLFSSEFFNCLISSETSNHFSLSDYFENAYDRSYDFCTGLPYVISSRDVSVTSPFSYEVSGLDAFCLIHTTRGTGMLFCDNPVQADASYELAKGTLAFVDCRRSHKLVCRHNIWEYTIVFVSASLSDYYYQKLSALGGCTFKPAAGSELWDIWQRISGPDTDDEAHGLVRCRELVSLYTQLYLTRLSQLRGAYHIPAYISDVKEAFDSRYNEQYSLDALARKYRVNKFRLCREFSKYYKDTPLQYLNGVRIRKAKELLLHSDEKIVNIGQMVGFENTSHFIRLFKEKTGVTPLTYRKETPVL